MLHHFGRPSQIAQFPLDQVNGVSASAAYSLRKLTKKFYGAPIRVRRSSDNTEMDIPFCVKDLCTTTLESFVGAENTIVNSEGFEALNILGVSLDIGITDAFGSANARKIKENSENSSHMVYTNTVVVTSGVENTFSIYLKKGERDWAALELYESGGTKTYMYLYVNLATGQLGTRTGGTSASITDVGNGWYRVSVTKTLSYTSATIVISPALSDGTGRANYQGVAGNGIYVFGMQMNQGTTAKPYNKTTVGVGGNGYVTTWYDQSGNGNHATQTTASNQPRIVNAGVVDLGSSNNPALTWINAANNARFDTISVPSKYVSIVCRYADGVQPTWLESYQGIFGFSGQPGDAGTGIISSYIGDRVWYVGNTFKIVSRNGAIDNQFALPMPESIFFANKSNLTTAQLIIGNDRGNNNRSWSGTISEFIMFGADLTDAQRQKLERNQGRYYNITVT